MPMKQEVKQNIKDKSIKQQKEKGSGSWRLSGGESFLEWKPPQKHLRIKSVLLSWRWDPRENPSSARGKGRGETWLDAGYETWQ